MKNTKSNKIITEEIKAELDKIIDQNERYINEVDYFNNLISKCRNDIELGDQLLTIVNIVQDIAYQEGFKQGLKIRKK